MEPVLKHKVETCPPLQAVSTSLTAVLQTRVKGRGAGARDSLGRCGAAGDSVPLPCRLWVARACKYSAGVKTTLCLPPVQRCAPRLGAPSVPRGHRSRPPRALGGGQRSTRPEHAAHRRPRRHERCPDVGHSGHAVVTRGNYWGARGRPGERRTGTQHPCVRRAWLWAWQIFACASQQRLWHARAAHRGSCLPVCG